MSLLVFTDTNALVAMHCFRPPDRTTLSSEVADAVEAGECRLLICNTVADELREVVAREKVERWRWDYNHFRPHSSLEDVPPSTLIERFQGAIGPANPNL